MSAALLQLLEQAEALINLDERGDALGVLAEARKCLAPTLPAEETDGEVETEIVRALEAIDRADALISTVAGAIANGDAHDGDVVYILQDCAWPQLEEARKALEQIRWSAERKDGAA